MPNWFGVAVPCTCATGCGNPDWPTSCPRCDAKRSMSARAVERWWQLPTSEERPTTRVNRSLAAIRHWGSSISPCSHTLIARTALPPSPPEEIEAWAAGLSVPAYVIDDETAIKVVEGNVEVVSEGNWKLLTPNPEAC